MFHNEKTLTHKNFKVEMSFNKKSKICLLTKYTAELKKYFIKFSGLTILTYFIAMLLHLFIELPISNLIKLMTSNTTMTSQTNVTSQTSDDESVAFKEENQSDDS